MEDNRMYSEKETPDMQRILQWLEYSSTNLNEDRHNSNCIDNCACPPCFCNRTIITLILSPVGIGTAGGVLCATSPL